MSGVIVQLKLFLLIFFGKFLMVRGILYAPHDQQFDIETIIKLDISKWFLLD